MSFKIVHFRKDCIGCNSCVAIAPQSWVMDEEEGKVRLVGAKEKRGVFVTEAFDCDLEMNRQAAQACPMKIIQINSSKN